MRSEKLKIIAEFIHYVGLRYDKNRCSRVAASLSYTSLLSLIPMFAVAFSVLAAFPMFDSVFEELQTIIFANFLPESAQVMDARFNEFLRNASSLPAFGIAGLTLTVILLFISIENSMNRIFNVTQPRRFFPRLFIFLAVITLGPLLMGISLTLSAYIFSMTRDFGVDLEADHFSYITRFLPTLMVMILFAAIYKVTPNRKVNIYATIIGGVVAGLLFALLRKLFGIYVVAFPTYQTVYGAVSVIPIFLVWTYLSWVVVLLGAVITASMCDWLRVGGRPARGTLRSGPKIAIALEVIKFLTEAPSVSHNFFLEHRTGRREEEMFGILAQLEKSGMIAKASSRRWKLSCDLEKTTLYELYHGLGFGMRDEDLIVDGKALEGDVYSEQSQNNKDWRIRLAPYMAALRDTQRDATSVTLKELL